MSNPPDEFWDELAKLGLPAEAVITPVMMRKRILWDAVPCGMAGDVMRDLNMSPGSEEVEDMEHGLSHARLEQVSPLSDLLHELSHHVAAAVTSAIMVGAREDDPDLTVEDSLREESERKMQPIIEVGARSILAELIDLGFVHLPHELTMLTPEGHEPQ